MIDIRDLRQPADRSVTLSLPVPGKTLPLLVHPSVPVPALEHWIGEHRDLVTHWLAACGAIMFRGFGVASPGEFERIARAASGDAWVDYREAATPRSHVSGHVNTATDFDPRYRLYLHNENSHVMSWPLRLFLFCQTPADTGGETSIADCRRVYRRLPRALVEDFQAHGWLYVRTFGYGLGLPWTKVFETDDKAGLAEYFTGNHMLHEWRPDGGLVVKYRRWATLRHPLGGETVWFNHGTFYNAMTLEPKLRQFLTVFGEDKLPYNTYYGNGARIAAETMRVLHDAYERETVRLPWQRGDVMMIDNMLVAHGREAFEGKREVFVTMTNKICGEQIAHPDDYRLPRLDAVPGAPANGGPR